MGREVKKAHEILENAQLYSRPEQFQVRNSAGQLGRVCIRGPCDI